MQKIYAFKLIHPRVHVFVFDLYSTDKLSMASAASQLKSPWPGLMSTVRKLWFGLVCFLEQVTILTLPQSTYPAVKWVAGNN